MRKVIISCAVTGSIHTPSMSPYLPITPKQIAEDAISAADAGASIIHLHARNPENGRPTPSPEVYKEFLPVIKKNTGAILNITTGGGMGMSLDERLSAALWAQPEIASMNMGSMNFNISGAGAKITEWQYEWEKPFLDSSKEFIWSNTFAQIQRAIEELSANGTKFEFEIYDIGQLYTLKYFVDQGIVKPPFFIQGVFGILGGISPDPSHILHLKETADKLFGDDFIFSALGAGRHQMPTITLSTILGGNVRVGLEDNLYIAPKQLATRSAEQVRKIRKIVEALGYEIATPDEAREMLDTKGRDNVNF